MSRPFRVMSYFSSYCRGMRSLQMRSRLENVELYIDYYKLYLFSLPRYWSIVAIRRDTGIIHHSLIIAIFIYKIKSFKQMLSGLIFWEIPLRKFYRTLLRQRNVSGGYVNKCVTTLVDGRPCSTPSRSIQNVTRSCDLSTPKCCCCENSTETTTSPIEASSFEKCWIALV